MSRGISHACFTLIPFNEGKYERYSIFYVKPVQQVPNSVIRVEIKYVRSIRFTKSLIQNVCKKYSFAGLKPLRNIYILFQRRSGV